MHWHRQKNLQIVKKKISRNFLQKNESLNPGFVGIFQNGKMLKYLVAENAYMHCLATRGNDTVGVTV
jgi:hypothetical protein